MMEYKQKGELFSLDLLRCLRTDYFHNDCQECLQICPEEAIFFDRKRLSVDFEKCINCSVCLGVCPSEALSLDFFDPNAYVLKNSNHLSCKKDIPCLSAFSSEHFISMALRSDELFIDLSHCEGCNLNPENRTLESIQARVGEAKRFLEESESGKSIKQKPYEPQRRGFFKALYNAAKDVASEPLPKSSIERLPVKTTLLKNSIKAETSNLQSHISTSYSFLAQKGISDECTNCGDCVQFCPTNALFFSQDGAAIWFVAGRCIDCNICNDICKPKAVSDKEQIDLITYAFDRGEELIHHRLEICNECKTPFAYKGGEMVCERCKSFINDFSDIFKLASDLE